MFSKVLIANRGEIAVRVMQACAEMGIRTVAVYSDADARALHVRRADESYGIGPSVAGESYLNVDRMIRAARHSGADAVHPGYGFLAENPDFAQACLGAGLIWVGPSPEAMRLLGDKRAAKRLARETGVPVVPGYDGDAQDLNTLSQQAETLGYPLLIKAASGGGGKGMRIVRTAEALAEAVEGAKREALSAFGDETLLLEKYIEGPRHVEIQVLADTNGDVVHLGERECSVQRRHQKVMEESPSPALTPELREEMGAAAVRLVRAAGYTNAGTVEFILSPEGEPFFMEVNTRLQVEHPVTELVTGFDLVREQLRIAAGMPLSITQDQVWLWGHALECRVYAEDPARGYLPSTGPLLLFEPPSGAGVRNDSGVETGDEVTPFYDPMLAKLVIHAPDRPSCLERARAALRRYTVLGVSTNLSLLAAVFDAPAFRAGDLSTEFLDQLLPELATTSDLPDEAVLAAAGWQLTARTSDQRDPWREGGWRLSGQERVLRYTHEGTELVVSASERRNTFWDMLLGGAHRRVGFERTGNSSLLLREGARTWHANVVETMDSLHIGLGGSAYVLGKARALTADDAGRAPSALGGRESLQAPMPGTVVKVAVREGDEVEAGQTLIVLEAMKMEHAIAAPHAGVVAKLPYSAGDLVTAGAVLAEVRE
ncbi:MAG: acetyl/propionyl/methylcrotonyl-CoA carboxylase subunit alpha [Chloroflexota bacterium]|nr:acetyl/propionyl/methylcrotonyl-CoA carboxylase subunit alpha [Chloroflexota bacterium]